MPEAEYPCMTRSSLPNIKRLVFLPISHKHNSNSQARQTYIKSWNPITHITTIIQNNMLNMHPSIHPHNMAIPNSDLKRVNLIIEKIVWRKMTMNQIIISHYVCNSIFSRDAVHLFETTNPQVWEKNDIGTHACLPLQVQWLLPLVSLLTTGFPH